MSPSWAESLELKLDSLSGDLLLHLSDSAVYKDEHVASATLKITDLLALYGTQKNTIKIKSNAGADAGTVVLKV